jgi:hypothetical protein
MPPFDRKLPEVKMTKAAFDKIKAALGETRAYLDGSADKREFRVHTPTDAKVDPNSALAQAQLPKEAT